MRALQTRLRNERGSALVEMAILAPFLIMLVLGVIEVGRMMFIQVDLNEAAQEGALFATFQPEDSLEIQNRVVESTDSLSLSVDNVEVDCLAANRVRVTVTKQVPLVAAFFLVPVTGDPMTMQGSVEGEVHSDAACDPSP